ncbi:hypothetical protein CN563_00145 [Bacillus sp. AFS026049]|nr:hypothetical protein CN563_00145 [Bacillus sp. AFS026049]
MTGGASGIGLSISALMAKEGAKVVIADFNEAGAKEAADIGYTVLFLVSDESKLITGQRIQVEGGHYIAYPSISDFNDYVTKAKSN